MVHAVDEKARLCDKNGSTSLDHIGSHDWQKIAFF